MGAYIEINDTLRITKEQGFPKELDYKKHISKDGGYFNAKMFEGKIFEFSEKGNDEIDDQHESQRDTE